MSNILWAVVIEDKRYGHDAVVYMEKPGLRPLIHADKSKMEEALKILSAGYKSDYLPYALRKIDLSQPPRKD